MALPLATAVNNLDVELAGPVYINQQGSLNLAGLNTSNLLDITASGNISNSAVLNSTGALSLTSTGNINISGNNQLTGGITLAGNSVSLANASITNLAGVTATDLSVNGQQSINATGDIAATTSAVLTSTGGDINLVNVTTPDLTVTATGNVTDTGNITVAGPATMTSSGAGVALNNLTSTSLNVTAQNGITASGNVIVNGATNLASASGDIVVDGAGNDFNTVNVTGTNLVSLNDINNIGLVLLTGNDVQVTAGGSIADANSGAMNIIANSVTLDAVNGIGGGSVAVDASNTFNLDLSNAIHTQTASLSVTNLNPTSATQKGAVNIDNTGDVTVHDLRNNGDIILSNTGEISLAVRAVSNGSGGVTSIGAIDANYGGSAADKVFAGNVAISGNSSNSVSTLGYGASEADITAENLLVQKIQFFGTAARPIRLNVHNQFTAITVGGAAQYPYGPPVSITTPDNFKTIDLSSVTGQLIEIESLGDVDPAIFTEVRNYDHEDVAILLPPDQRLSDDDDSNCSDNDGKKCKKARRTN